MLRILLIAFFAILASCQSGHKETGTTSSDVYFFRGLMGLKYSTGLDTLADRLQRHGHKVRVLSHTNRHNVFWEIINSGRKRVALIGHSMGGKTAVALAADLAKEGVQVCLLATIDPVGNGIVSRNVRVAMNWHQGRFSPLIAGKGFKGTIQNIAMDGWKHIDLDEAEIIHNRVAAVLGSRCR